MLLEWSLIYAIKNNGPKIDPLGTSALTRNQLDDWSLIVTV